MRFAKYTGVFLSALGLLGCTPRTAPKPDLPAPRIPEAEAIRLARNAYKASGISLKPTDSTVATFDLLPLDPLKPNAPGRAVWLVVIGPPGKRIPAGQRGLPYAYIDDKTGNVSMILGTETIVTPSQEAAPPEPPGARLKRAEAIMLAWSALQEAGVPVGIHAISEARFVKRKWRIVFSAPKVLHRSGQMEAPRAVIDDSTGSVEIVLGGEASTDRPQKQEPEPPGARIKRADAIRSARKAFQKAGMPPGFNDVPDARYIKVKAHKKVPEHYEWWVFFMPDSPAKERGAGVSGAYIDDRTGKVRIKLGAE